MCWHKLGDVGSESISHRPKFNILFSILVPKNFHSWWKIDKVLRKIILHSFLRHDVCCNAVYGDYIVQSVTQTINTRILYSSRATFLTLEEYMRSVCKETYILRTDRPATSDQRPATDDRRPINDLIFGKIQMAIYPQEVVRSTSCLVLGWGFRGRRIKWRYLRCDQIQ